MLGRGDGEYKTLVPTPVTFEMFLWSGCRSPQQRLLKLLARDFLFHTLLLICDYIALECNGRFCGSAQRTLDLLC
jgi:hypothetical protein